MMGTRSPVTGTRSPAMGTRSPAMGTRSPAMGTRSPAMGTRSPAMGTRSPATGLVLRRWAPVLRRRDSFSDEMHPCSDDKARAPAMERRIPTERVYMFMYSGSAPTRGTRGTGQIEAVAYATGTSGHFELTVRQWRRSTRRRCMNAWPPGMTGPVTIGVSVGRMRDMSRNKKSYL